MDRYGGRCPAGAGRGRHGVEQLPGEPLDGRAGEDVQRGERGARRVHERRGSREPETQVDIALFIQWVEADLHDDEVIAHLLPSSDSGRSSSRRSAHGSGRTRSRTRPRPTRRSRCRNTSWPPAGTRRTLEATADATAETARLYVQRATNYVAVSCSPSLCSSRGSARSSPRPGLRFLVNPRREPCLRDSGDVSRDVPRQLLDLDRSEEPDRYAIPVAFRSGTT